MGGVQGPQAHMAGVTFPKDQAALDRTLLVGNLNPSVTDEQVCGNPRCNSLILQLHDHLGEQSECDKFRCPSRCAFEN